jgi:predicted  nucleic acid-binding Zn-ribbon protein
MLAERAELQDEVNQLEQRGAWAQGFASAELARTKAATARTREQLEEARQQRRQLHEKLAAVLPDLEFEGS